jgi:diguanylate cyclase (GGDEF)-like protein/PAS domain S-box-containing protein
MAHAQSKTKARILVVEDEAIVARDIQVLLESLGYEVAGHSGRGEDAIALTTATRPDLVLMDIQLAGSIDGIAAAHAIRANTDNRVPVVFLTAFDADETLARARLTEPYGYILKPFSDRELHAVLEMALYKSQVETALREAGLYREAILENMVDGVIAFDQHDQIESCNRAAKHIFGFEADEVLGRPITALVPAHQRPQLASFLQHMQDQDASHFAGQSRQLSGQRRNGSEFPLNLSLSRIVRSGHSTLVALARDMSPQKEAAEEIYFLAFYDRLTGLPNRRLLLDYLKQALLTSVRSGQHGALILLDLDNFKRLNDTMGYALGDELLCQVAKRLKATVRESDQVARVGGDEFVVLLSALSSNAADAASQAEATASKLLLELGKPYFLQGHVHSNTPSLGIVMFLAQERSLEALLQNAEIAMYRAKEAGRTTFRFFDATMQAAIVERSQRVTALQQALEQQDFVLHYQAQVNRMAQPIGVEALVRWKHAARGLVSPSEFIALAEETRMILPLGQWVLEQACAQLALWESDPQKASWTMSVNVSALQFAQPNFVASVLAALDHSGANPRQLKLELTESMLVNDVQGVIAKMNALKDHCVKFSLDDFGTGYSSLSYLKQLPLDQLKIDQSFVRDLLIDTNDAVIARAIVALGHSLGLQVIAEGVETKEQHKMLSGLQCDAFQGYLFARPGPADQMHAAMEENAA